MRQSSSALPPPSSALRSCLPSAFAYRPLNPCPPSPRRSGRVRPLPLPLPVPPPPHPRGPPCAPSPSPPRPSLRPLPLTPAALPVPPPPLTRGPSLCPLPLSPAALSAPPPPLTRGPSLCPLPLSPAAPPCVPSPSRPRPYLRPLPLSPAALPVPPPPHPRGPSLRPLPLSPAAPPCAPSPSPPRPYLRPLPLSTAALPAPPPPHPRGPSLCPLPLTPAALLAPPPPHPRGPSLCPLPLSPAALPAPPPPHPRGPSLRPLPLTPAAPPCAPSPSPPRPSIFWTLDCTSDWTHGGGQRPRPLHYIRSSGATSEWSLDDGPPPSCTVLASHCPTCGRPAPHEAAVAFTSQQAPLVPSLFCTSPRRPPPYCTRALAPRCHFYQQGQPLRVAVPVHVLPWSDLCSPHLPVVLLPPPQYLRYLPPPAQPDASLVQPTALVIMTHNWGGIALQTALARLWVEALQPDVLCWHELWDHAAARLAIPPSYESIWSTATGPGTGFVIAWRSALRRRPEEATLAYDGDHCLGALLPVWHVGRLLICNVHLHPKIPYREWIRQLRHMDQLRRDLRPDFSYITGDFNSTDSPGTPLAQALRPGGTLHDYLRVIPPGTTTNHTVVQGRPRSTAIDHSFLHGPVAAAHHQLLPSRSSHAVIVVTITLHTQSADAWGWRRFRWRRATLEDMEHMATALDLVWGWLAFAPAQPDEYVAAHHAVAGQLIPRPPDQGALLRRLSSLSFPLSPAQLDQQITALREAAEDRGYQDRLEILRTASITAATRRALHLPSPPSSPSAASCPGQTQSSPHGMTDFEKFNVSPRHRPATVTSSLTAPGSKLAAVPRFGPTYAAPRWNSPPRYSWPCSGLAFIRTTRPQHASTWTPLMPAPC